ncbi:MAG TPA: hypothetical protein VJU83_12995 [Burkholderiales bacterium]|nr:hypothetical protein [Burkholderiales bacterium]
MNLNEMRSRVELLGVSGVLGIALLVFAFTVYAATLVPLANETEHLQNLADQLKTRHGMGGMVDDSIGTPDEQLASFYAFFPKQESTTEWLIKIHAAANESGIALRSGDYKLEHRDGDRLSRYLITLPLRGSYPQIRSFIDHVLQDVPAAALNELSLQRDSVSSEALDARIRLTLYLGAL